MEHDSNAVPEQPCSQCGSRLGPHAFSKDGERFCCEGCYLARLNLAAMGPAPMPQLAAFAESLSDLLDMRERETALHSRRVTAYALVLADHADQSRQEREQLYLGALLHDVGKLAIPDTVLLKRGPLDDVERDLMRTHSERGHHFLSKVPGFDQAARIVLAHHEHYDGSGYPQGLQGREIPRGAALFAIGDALDAMTSDRPYRLGMSFDAAFAEIIRGAGHQFDPDAVTAFAACAARLCDMVEAHGVFAEQRGSEGGTHS